MVHAVKANGVVIVRTPTGIGVNVGGVPFSETLLRVEVDYHGKRLKNECLQPNGPPWRDYFGKEYDHLKCVVRVRQGDAVLAELSLPDEEYPLPFMVRQGEQVHVTENYVSCPPALTITDSVGAVWTLGFLTAPKDQSPDGEFAFEVLRDGVGTHEIASRIEQRNSKIRIFTRHGWKKWTGSSFF